MGFAADRMDDAANAALGLSHATGTDAAQSMDNLKSAIEGNFEAFHAVNPQIMFMRSNQEKLAAVMAIANQGLTDQSEDMGTVAGSGRRANSSIVTMMESIGAIMAPIRVLISAGLQQLATSFNSILVPAVEYAQSVLENIGPLMDYVKQKIVDGVNIAIGAFTFFEVILTNLSSVWDIVVATAELAMVGMAESVMHTLTVVIPEYASWFAENFVNTLSDGMSFAFIVVEAGIKKLVDGFKALWGWIASAGQSDVLRELGEISGRKYSEGFESSITSLPDIAVRKLTQREKDLADKIGAIGGRLGEEFADKMKGRMVGVGEGVTAELKKVGDIDLKSQAHVMTQGVSATQGRLLTRGPGTNMPNLLNRIIKLLEDPPVAKKPPYRTDVKMDEAAVNELMQISKNTSVAIQMEAIA